MEGSPLLKFTSYNCKSFGEDKYKICKELITNSTFVLLQEHWQYERQFINNVKSIMPNIDCVVTSPMNENLTKLGRGKGGVAIIWRNNIKCNIEAIECVSKRLCAIKVHISNISFISFNVYMPTDPGFGNHNINEYKEVLPELSVIVANEVSDLTHNAIHF